MTYMIDLDLIATGDGRNQIATTMALASIPLLIWGCMSFAEGKGYSKWFGIWGAVGVIGLIVLLVLPPRIRLHTCEKSNF